MSDNQLTLPGCSFDEFQEAFWGPFRAEFPELHVEGVTTECCDVRLQVRSPDGRENREMLIILERKLERVEWWRPEIIVAFGGGHVHCSLFGDRPPEEVISTAMEMVREIVAGERVGVAYEGGGVLCHTSELDEYFCEGARLQSWNDS